MSSGDAHIPTASQTVGPYFRIGLEYLIERTPAIAPGTAAIHLRGRVLDRDGAPVPDAMLEFWNAAKVADRAAVFPPGFRRIGTDADGNYSVVMERPTAVSSGHERAHAPHIMVLVFARGLMRHLISRVYFADEQLNEIDPVLTAIPNDRRATLIAQLDENRASLYRWDVILQGAGETVFFAW